MSERQLPPSLQRFVDEPEKALSLKQPWATLVDRRAKKLETRSWYTSYRGPLVIHASAAFPEPCRNLVNQPEFTQALSGIRYCELLRGYGLCVVDLIACVKTTELHKLKAMGLTFSASELLFGNFTPGRYAWALEWKYSFPEPIPARGALKLWEWHRGRAVA